MVTGIKRIRHRVHYFPAGFSTLLHYFFAKRKRMEKVKLLLSLFFFSVLITAIPYETVTAKFRFLSFIFFAPKSHGIKQSLWGT